MSDPKKPVDPLAQTGFAQQPIDPLAATAFGAQSPASTAHGGMAGIDPLSQTAHAGPVAPAPAQPPRTNPTPRPRSNGLRWAVLAIVLVATAVAAIVTASKSDPPKPTVAAAPSLPAPPPPPPPREYAGTVEGLLAIQDRALADGTSAPFETLLAPDIWGIGLGADEVRFGADTNDELVRHVIGMQVPSFTKKRWIGRTADGAWAATVYTFADGHQVELTEAMTSLDGHWRIDAWHWSMPLANGRAYELAQAGMLPKPAALPEGKAVPDPTIVAMLNDRATYVAAISPRDDAFAFGSAPGEIMAGGSVITRAFSHMDATFSVRSGPIVRHVAGDLAFALANVDFTNKAGIQTFRVLLVLQGGKIVQAHWSNAATTADSTTGSGRSASPPAR